MAKKKKKVRKGNIFVRMQRSPKIKSIRAKIRKQKAAAKKLTREYKKAVKSFK